MKIKREFEVIFHNQGLRSWIECTLCWSCPRDNHKGCCFYNPTFYPLDFIYMQENNPELIDFIFKLPRVTVLEKYVGIDRMVDADGDYRCQLHSLHGGCIMAPDLRESVCRQYICPGCRIWEEEDTSCWREFFDRLDACEKEINQEISAILGERGLSFKTGPQEFIREACRLYYQNWPEDPFAWCRDYPSQQRYRITREMAWGKDWKI